MKTNKLPFGYKRLNIEEVLDSPIPILDENKNWVMKGVITLRELVEYVEEKEKKRRRKRVKEFHEALIKTDRSRIKNRKNK